MTAEGKHMTDTKQAITLRDVQETALIPLAIKASESLRKNNRIYDGKAVEIIKELGIDTKKYDKYFSHEGVVSRTIMFDNTVRKLLEKYPDANIINIGCGFDDRFSRVDNGIAHWYHIDLPDSIEVRRKVFEAHDRQTLVAADLTADSWTDSLPDDNVTIIIAEGLLMYFTEQQVRELLQRITEHFQKGFVLAELMHPIAMGNEKIHDTVKSTNAKFTFGTENGKELESYCSGLKLIKEANFFAEMRKHHLVGKIGSLFAGKIMNRLAVYKFCRQSIKNQTQM